MDKDPSDLEEEHKETMKKLYCYSFDARMAHILAQDVVRCGKK